MNESHSILRWLGPRLACRFDVLCQYNNVRTKGQEARWNSLRGPFVEMLRAVIYVPSEYAQTHVNHPPAPPSFTFCSMPAKRWTKCGVQSSSAKEEPRGISYEGSAGCI